MNADLAARIARLLGSEPVAARPIARGYTPATRLALRLADGRAAFAKLATNADTAGWLRQEWGIYARVRAPFLPAALAFEDDPAAPLLLLEDLSDASWPPPWDPARIAAVRAALAEVAALRLPHLPAAAVHDLGAGWEAVARSPSPFLGLGLVTSRWLESALPALRAAAAAAVLAGDDTVHLDVRSDNLCFWGGQAVLVDWNWASRGSSALDLAFWLPSLRAEGGPPPESSLDAPPLAAAVAGFFASRAGLPVIPHAPHVRAVQRRQLGAALPWAIRALGLPAADGPAAEALTP